MKYKKRKRQTKKPEDLVAHFQKRCLARIGVILCQRVLKNKFITRQLKTLRKQSHSRTLFVLKKENYSEKTLNEDVVLVYDKIRHTFVTVMPYLDWQKTHDECGRRKSS